MAKKFRHSQYSVRGLFLGQPATAADDNPEEVIIVESFICENVKLFSMKVNGTINGPVASTGHHRRCCHRRPSLRELMAAMCSPGHLPSYVLWTIRSMFIMVSQICMEQWLHPW